MASILDAITTTLHINDKKDHSDVHAPLHSISQQISSASEEISSKHLHTVVERTLGETEASYFLPSRESGVNDM
jgi:DNA-binding FrmR family transcriptional regulator